MPTNQETFDAVVAHARKQNARAVSAAGGCRYRTVFGKKCFYGCLIPDEDYDPVIEGEALSLTPPGCAAWTAARVLWDITQKLGHDLRLAKELQEVHDHKPVDDWECGFRRIAANYELTYTPPG